MVRGSLVAKVYLYGVTVLIASGCVVLLAARFLLDSGHLDAMRQLGKTQALLIAGEVERTASDAGPNKPRLLALGTRLHTRLSYVPWSQAGRYPDMLASDKVYFDPGLLPGPSWRRYWVRLDGPHGQPLGALAVEYGPRGTRLVHVPAVATALGMGGLALILIPPLWLWVLRPMRRMVGVAERLAAGDLKTPVERTQRDEFGELEEAFEGLRRRVQEMLGQKQKLLGDMSHELRGPLSRMAIAVPLLDEQGPPAEALARNIAAMDALIGELLALARAQTPEALAREPLDLAAIAEAEALDRSLAIENAGLALATTLAPAPALGDARQLARAVGNLLDNAVKYTPAGGRLQLATGRDEQGPWLRVVDDGPGIAPEHLPHVFEPFYRPDTSRSRETGGVGLGLAIVRAIAEAHGGTAELAVANGTSVTLRLPPV